MKTPFLTGFVLLAAFLICLYSCQKNNDSQVVPAQLKSTTTETARVTNWLQALTNSRTGAQKDRILTIQKNLLLAKLEVVPGVGDQTLVVVPLGKEFRSNRNKEQTAVHTFILTIGKEGKIVQGNTVQYIPQGSVTKELPGILFSNMVNGKPVEADGRFVYLGIFDEYLYEVQYKDGIQKSFAERRPRSNNSSHTASRQRCTDWYLQTYENGVLISEEYLFTTCGNSIDNEEVGPDGGGGGNDIDYEYQVSKDVIWTVYDDGGGGNRVNSTEKISGRRKRSGDEFTGIEHKSSYMVGITVNSWAEKSKTVGYTASQASASVTGIFSRNPSGSREETGSKSWTFAEVF